MRAIRYVMTGAAVLVVLVGLWWVLGVGVSQAVGRKNAGVVALALIVVAGWGANALLIWLQTRRHGPSPR